MSDPASDDRVVLAGARAAAARARLSGTIAELRDRARPASLAHEVTTTLKERGTTTILGLIDTAKRNPAQTGAAAALVGVFLARNKLMRWFRRGRLPSPEGSKSRKGGSAQ